MKALIISGGGAKGAFGGGMAEYFIKQANKQYDIFVGASTGSLLVPLLALGEIDSLKKAYTSIQQKDIFKICPFNIKKKQGKHQISINHFNVIRMFLRRSNTFGDSSNLRKTISKSLSQQQFDLLKKSPKEVVVTVSNLSLRQVEYKSINNCTYHDFCDWMWLSANMIPFMSLVTKNNMSYADGGICNNIPIQVAIDKGATEIDVIVLSPEHQTINTKPNKNVFSLTFDIFDLIMAQLNASKIEYALHQTICTKKEVQIRCYYTPRVLTETPLVFDAEEMSKWWHEGFKYAQHCLNQ